ncbi:MAG: hypothetical protein U9N60_03550 [Thermodesulfobacteriota bacterium]|nr:hypothetical protein [Thermodesulfobacteriota bacterium]
MTPDPDKLGFFLILHRDYFVLPIHSINQSTLLEADHYCPGKKRAMLPNWLFIIGLDVVFALKAGKDKIGGRKKAVQNKKNNLLFILSQRDI